MQAFNKARSLVCDRCWGDLFGLEKYERLCMSERFGKAFIDKEDQSQMPCQEDDEIDAVQFAIPIAELERTAGNGCSWCDLLRCELKRECGSDGSYQLMVVHLSPGFDYQRAKPFGANTFNAEFCLENKIGREYTKFKTFIAFTSQDDRAADYVSTRPTRIDMHPTSFGDQVRSWLRDCETHDCCNLPADAQLPTRVIEISPDEHPECPRLVYSEERRGRYATLSYCWGSSRSGILESQNISRYLKRLPLEALPQTIKDAIMVARAVSIRYIWIDALCILQDCEDDKFAEISTMDATFRNSFMTIVAANADHASKGFLGLRPSHTTFTVPFRIKDNDYGTMSLQFRDDILYYESKEPINKRGWTLQEQGLAQRLLYFASNTLQFRCTIAQRNIDNSPDVRSVGYEARRLFLPKSLGLPLSKLPDHFSNPVEAFFQWCNLIENYSARQFSLDEDKLPALAGLAKVFGPRLDPNFYAGIWEFRLLWQLGWHVDRLNETSNPTSIYCAPSWSWASLNAEIRYSVIDPTFAKDPVLEPACELVHIETTPKSSKVPFGAVTQGFIQVRARVRQGFLIRTDVRFKMQGWTIIWQDGSTDTSEQAEEEFRAWQLHDRSQPLPNVATLDVERPRDALLVTCLLLFRRLHRDWGLVLQEDSNWQEGGKESHKFGNQLSIMTGRKVYRRIGYFEGDKFVDNFEHNEEVEITIV